jgi:hypothetical protein
MPEMSLDLREPYRTRSIRPLELWTIEPSWRLKVYGIAYDAEVPREPLIAAARDAVQAELAGADTDGHGVGWVTVHDARDGVFVLVDWWGGENMIYQRLWYGAADLPIVLTPGDRDAPVMCVWELAIAAAERRAWIDCVLANRAGPDLERYLAERVSDDL